MAKTTLNMQLLLRRNDVFASTYKLAAGEPGFEISTNILKIGDGTKTWAELPFANEEEIAKLIKVTDDKVVELTDAVSKLDSTYATDAEVEAIRAALDAAKLDKETYNGYIATHAMTDEQINKAISDVDAKFADYTTTAAQQVIDSAQDIKISGIETTLATLETKENVKKVADDLAAYKEANDDAVEAAQKTADDITGYVGTFTHDSAKTVIEYINAKTDGIATSSNLEALAGRVTANEQAISAINDEETGILAEAKAYTDAGDIFVTDMLTVDKFGGIAGGADLNGKTTHQILTDLLYPYIAFVINSSSRSAAAATLECGESQTLSSATINVTKKKDPITSIKLLNGSTILEEKTGDAVANGGTIKFDGFDPITVTKSNNPNLKFTVTDGTTSTDKSVGASTFVYPYYWGVCAEDATIDETLVESLTKNVSGKGTKTDIAFTCANQKIVFAYPKAHGVLKSIIDPNNFETIDGYARSEVSITGLDGSAQAYYVYVLKDACTVSGFKVDFKY